MATSNMRLFALWATYYLSFVLGNNSSSSSSAVPASITPSPSAPAYGSNGSCSKFCGYAPVYFTSVYWSQWITPVTVGTVLVIVDDSDNTTKTTTVYNSGDAIVGSATIPISDLINSGLLPTASTTNTGEVTGFDGSTTTITYPTPWWTIDSEISWAGTIPVTNDGTSECSTWGGVTASSASNGGGFPFSLQASPLPTHAPWPTESGSVDPDDKYGALYTVQDYYEKETLSRGDIATLFPDDPFLLDIYGCTIGPGAAPATAVQSVGALLATSG
ncbi:hypothetical protein LTR09_009071 [Extremus antarcticus]|uniref:Uncharacterized protein n=1 Tax=Extremus antarcticus TaxID=702011 RepID=A0AAJ0DGV4_9PEZI|nr:hypothetical protein LTR09_009071 [Extremus antarcticus]